MADYCEMSDLPTDTCAHCLGHVAPEEEQDDTGRVTGGVFGA